MEFGLCGARRRSGAQPPRLYFSWSLHGVHVANIRCMAHSRDLRTPWEIMPGALAMPKGAGGWLIVTFFAATPDEGHTTPIGACTFASIGDPQPLHAAILRVGDACFEEIGAAVLTPVSVLPKGPPAARTLKALLPPRGFSAAALPANLRRMASAPVPYYWPADKRVLTDTVVPILAPFVWAAREASSGGGDDDSNTRGLWLSLLRHAVHCQRPGLSPAAYVDAAEPTVHRQLLEDLLALVALRGEFYPDQMWNVADRERREDCDFYINLLCHPDPAAAAGDCEDRSMALMTAFEALSRVEVSVVDAGVNADMRVLRDVIQFARRLEACAVDAIVHTDGIAQKHMIVWLVPREMLSEWAARGAGPGPGPGAGYAAGGGAATLPFRVEPGWVPAMPMMVETAFELVYGAPHRSVIATPAPDAPAESVAAVDQVSVAEAMVTSHVMYVTLYCVADTRGVTPDAGGYTLVARDLYAGADSRAAGMPVPSPAEMKTAWSSVCTRERAVRVTHDLAPVAKLAPATLARIVQVVTGAGVRE